jgi:hypothetical protein
LDRRIWLGNFRQTRAIRRRADHTTSRGKNFEKFFACEAIATKRLGKLREQDNRIIVRGNLFFTRDCD